MSTVFDRKLQGDYIKKKLKELNDFCSSNGIDCRLTFGGGFEHSSRFVTKENGELSIESSGITRTFTAIGIKITLTDSDKGDNVLLIDSIMDMLLSNIQTKDENEHKNLNQ